MGFLAILILIIFIGCSNSDKKTYTTPDTLVRVERVQLEKSYNKIILAGQLKGAEEVNIFADANISGIIRRIRVSEGDKVRFGTPLMDIDQTSVTGYKFKDFIVRSKISGIVSDIYVENGTLAMPQMRLAKVIRIKKLKLEVDISEADISKVRKGQLVYFYVKSYPNEKFTGKLTEIFPTLDPNTLTLRAEVMVDNKSYKLKPGMFARSEIVISEAMKLLIPLNSMIIEDNIRYVYVYNPSTKRVNHRVITTGNHYDKKIEVTSGLNIGDFLIVEGNYQVVDNIKVRVKGL